MRRRSKYRPDISPQIINRAPTNVDLPRFRGEMRAWDQAPWLYVMLSSGPWHSLVRPPAEPFFRPDPCTDAAAAALSTHSSHWGRHPAADTCWQSDSPPGDRSRTGTLPWDRVRLPSEP